MKKTLPLIVLCASILSSCSSSYLAQNGEFDGVYDPGGDAVVYYASETEQEQDAPMADYDYVDPEFDPNNMSEYEYSSRIRRFHSDTDFGYYDPYYTNMGYYNPNPGNFGTSIYSDAYGFGGSPYGNGVGSGWNTGMGWNSWSGWSFSLGYSWGNPYGPYGPMAGFGYNPYNPWNNFDPWNPYGGYGYPYCPNYYNSLDVNSFVYAPRGQSQPNQAGYVQNAYQGAIKSGTITPPAYDELVASTEPATRASRTVKNESPAIVHSTRSVKNSTALTSIDGRTTSVRKNAPDRIESRDIQTRANTYYRQMERFTRGQNGFLNQFEQSNTQNRAQSNNFLERLEQATRQWNVESMPSNSRGWQSPSLNRNQGGQSPAFRGNNGSGGSSPTFRSGGSNSRGGSSGGGSRGGSSGGGSRGGRR